MPFLFLFFACIDYLIPKLFFKNLEWFHMALLTVKRKRIFCLISDTVEFARWPVLKLEMIVLQSFLFLFPWWFFFQNCQGQCKQFQKRLNEIYAVLATMLYKVLNLSEQSWKYRFHLLMQTVIAIHSKVLKPFQ